MPGSWNQSGRKLIHEITETCRLHFKKICCYRPDLTLRATDAEFDLFFPTNVYGGVFFQKLPTVQALSTEFPVDVKPLNMDLHCQTFGAESLMPPIEVKAIPPFTSDTIPTCPIPLLSKAASVVACPTDIPHQGSTCSIPKSQISLYATKAIKKLSLDRLKKPIVYRTPKLTGRIAKLPAQKYQLPILRKPIPPHRFSKENRAQFRELLGEKSKLPLVDIKIIGVYDRIFLGMYQSISQTEDGSLLCVPKAKTELQLLEREPVSVYLVVGQSIKTPGKSYQVVLPMKDLAHGKHPSTD